MKKSVVHLSLTVIWGLAACVWIANLMRYTESGTVNWLHVVTAVCAVICCVLNLVQYSRVRKAEK